VIGVDKLKKKFKSFEQKRQLLNDYEIFMVDDRVIKIVADFLGKTFYQSKSKRPVPIRLTAGAYVDKTAKKDAKEPQGVVGTAQGIAKEIESALNATYLSMSASANTSIRVGKLSMTAQQIKENTAAVVAAIIPKHVEQGWRNVRALHIKGAATKALPIWLADELWISDAQVLDEPWKGTKTGEGKTAQQKRKWDEWEQELLDDDELAEKRARKDAKKAKKAAPEKKSAISKEKKKALKDAALQSVQTPLIA
jgi:ribosome biogenesis protein UTP30